MPGSSSQTCGTNPARSSSHNPESLQLKLKNTFQSSCYHLRLLPTHLRNSKDGTKNIEKEMEFIDLDDMDQWRSDLPRKFSELTDENFPLFITYDQVCVHGDQFFLFFL
jgi:hypothetical protein